MFSVFLYLSVALTTGKYTTLSLSTFYLMYSHRDRLFVLSGKGSSGLSQIKGQSGSVIAIISKFLFYCSSSLYKLFEFIHHGASLMAVFVYLSVAFTTGKSNPYFGRGGNVLLMQFYPKLVYISFSRISTKWFKIRTS